MRQWVTSNRMCAQCACLLSGMLPVVNTPGWNQLAGLLARLYAVKVRHVRLHCRHLVGRPSRTCTTFGVPCGPQTLQPPASLCAGPLAHLELWWDTSGLLEAAIHASDCCSPVADLLSCAKQALCAPAGLQTYLLGKAHAACLLAVGTHGDCANNQIVQTHKALLL